MIRECLLCRQGDDVSDEADTGNARCTCHDDCFSWLCKAAGKVRREPVPRERYV